MRQGCQRRRQNRSAVSLGELAGQGRELLAIGDHVASTAICYEVIFPSLIRRFVNDGSELLTTITNDAWYGRSSAAYQHWEQASMRAIEHGRYLARAANTNAAAADMIVGIGEDSTSVALGTTFGRQRLNPIANGSFPVECVVDLYPAVGRHFYAWLERSDGGVGTTTWYGTSQEMRSGMTGFYEG